MTWTIKNRPEIGQIYTDDSDVVEVRAIWEKGLVCRAAGVGFSMAAADFLNNFKEVAIMRTLEQVVTLARLGQFPTYNELRLALVASDVLIARLKPEENPVQLAEYFRAASEPLDVYLGKENSPDDVDAVAWYRTFINFKFEADAMPKNN